MFELRFDTDNAAFDGHALRAEIARILRSVARSVGEDSTAMQEQVHTVRDVNGNRIGLWRYEGREN